MKIGKAEFDISYQEISDIMNYILDEFPELEYYIEGSNQSSLINEDENSFIITLQDEDGDIHTLPVLYYIEPKIFNLIQDINSQLGQYDLYVFHSDFGQTDQFYELVICRVGHEPTMIKKNYTWESFKLKRFKDFNKFESSTMPESDINEYIEIISDIFTDISDVWNIEYQGATFDSGENSIDSDYDNIYIQIEIDNKIDKVKFIDDIFLFTEKVKSFTGLKEEYWVAGNKYNTKSSVLREFSKKSNNGEYLSIAFFF